LSFFVVAGFVRIRSVSLDGIRILTNPATLGGKSFGSVGCFLVTFLLGIAILMGDDPASDSFDLS
jgi:hypothetical protein